VRRRLPSAQTFCPKAQGVSSILCDSEGGEGLHVESALTQDHLREQSASGVSTAYSDQLSDFRDPI
jgi:hypothetical protein